MEKENKDRATKAGKVDELFENAPNAAASDTSERLEEVAKTEMGACTAPPPAA